MKKQKYRDNFSQGAAGYADILGKYPGRTEKPAPLGVLEI